MFFLEPLSFGGLCAFFRTNWDLSLVCFRAGLTSWLGDLPLFASPEKVPPKKLKITNPRDRKTSKPKKPSQKKQPTPPGCTNPDRNPNSNIYSSDGSSSIINLNISSAVNPANRSRTVKQISGSGNTSPASQWSRRARRVTRKTHWARRRSRGAVAQVWLGGQRMGIGGSLVFAR